MKGESSGYPSEDDPAYADMVRRERAAAEAEAAAPPYSEEARHRLWQHAHPREDLSSDEDERLREDMSKRASEIENIQERSEFVRQEVARLQRARQDRQSAQSSGWQPAEAGTAPNVPPECKSVRENSRTGNKREDAGRRPEARDDAKIDLNIATIWQLKSCPKVGNILAHRIVASRQAEKFTSWSEVRRLPSIGKGITNHLQKKFFLLEDDEDEPERRFHVMVKDTKAKKVTQNPEGRHLGTGILTRFPFDRRCSSRGILHTLIRNFPIS